MPSDLMVYKSLEYVCEYIFSSYWKDQFEEIMKNTWVLEEDKIKNYVRIIL